MQYYTLTKHSIDTNRYNEDGIPRCSFNETAKKLLDKKGTYPKDEDNHFFMASKRLGLQLKEFLS